MSKRIKIILDSFVIKMYKGEEIHRYSVEAEFEKVNKKYSNSQLVEIYLLDASKTNSDYKRLFDIVYGNMPKYGGGEFGNKIDRKLFLDSKPEAGEKM